MGKISLSVPDSILHIIEEEGKKPGKNRSSFVAEAVEFLVGKGRNLEDNNSRLTTELAEVKKNLLQKENDVFQMGKRNQSLENQVAELSRKLESQVGSLEDKVGKLEEELLTSRNQLQEAIKQKAQSDSALGARMDEIAFLHSHIAQLSQTIQLALPPGKEEIKKKSWWRFWKKE
jgi:chromosome segregation ATPase